MRSRRELLVLATLLAGCDAQAVRTMAWLAGAVVVVAVLLVVAVVNIVIDEVRVRGERRRRTATGGGPPDPRWPSSGSGQSAVPASEE
jgi:hypothetical protein